MTTTQDRLWQLFKRCATAMFLVGFVLDSIVGIIEIVSNGEIGGSAFRPAVAGALWFLSARLDDLETHA